MHPCISQSREHLQKALYEENAFTRMLQKMEDYTGVSRPLLVSFLTGFIAIYLLIGYGSELVGNAIFFVLPANFTLLSIDGTNDTQKKWFAYWIIFTTITIGEFFIRRHLTLYPLYWLVKCLFMLWCCLPIEHNGSMLFYDKIIHPFYRMALEYSGKQGESSCSKMLDRDHETTLSEKKEMEMLPAEKKQKVESKSSKSRIFGKSTKQKKKKKDEGSEDERSVKSSVSKSVKSESIKSGSVRSVSIKNRSERSVSVKRSSKREGSVRSDSVISSAKSITSSIFGSGKQTSSFSKKKKKQAGEDDEVKLGESATSDAESIVAEKAPEQVEEPEIVESAATEIIAESAPEQQMEEPEIVESAATEIIAESAPEQQVEEPENAETEKAESVPAAEEVLAENAPEEPEKIESALAEEVTENATEQVEEPENIESTPMEEVTENATEQQVEEPEIIISAPSEEVIENIPEQMEEPDNVEPAPVIEEQPIPDEESLILQREAEIIVAGLVEENSSEELEAGILYRKLGTIEEVNEEYEELEEEIMGTKEETAGESIEETQEKDTKEDSEEITEEDQEKSEESLTHCKYQSSENESEEQM